MKVRRTTSLTAFLSFMILLLTGIILYIVPHGRVAYWSNWRLWGLSKNQWSDLHINIGILFLLSIFTHIYFNWRPIINYLKSQSGKIKFFSREFNISVILLFAFAFGTYLNVPPFRCIIGISESIKESAAEKYGEPPYGHAELSSIKVFTRKEGIDIKSGMDRLFKAGIKVKDENQTIQDVAKSNGITPKQVYLAMKEEKIDSANVMPETPRPGTGKLTIGELCFKYNLDTSKVLGALSNQNINSKEDMTIRSIAAQNNISTIDIYYLIKSSFSK